MPKLKTKSSKCKNTKCGLFIKDTSNFQSDNGCLIFQDITDCDTRKAPISKLVNELILWRKEFPYLAKYIKTISKQKVNTNNQLSSVKGPLF